MNRARERDSFVLRYIKSSKASACEGEGQQRDVRGRDNDPGSRYNTVLHHTHHMHHMHDTTHTHTHAHAHTHTRTRTRTHTHTHTCTCMHALTHTHTHTQVYRSSYNLDSQLKVYTLTGLRGRYIIPKLQIEIRPSKFNLFNCSYHYDFSLQCHPYPSLWWAWLQFGINMELE